MAAKKSKVGKLPIVHTDEQPTVRKAQLTKLERQARREVAQSIRIAATCGPSYAASSGGGFGGSGGADISSADANFFSPQLSTDFLELPQSEREKRELFRFYYQTNPIVGAAIDFHCFPAGAPVMLKDGSVRPIELMKIGDEVINGFGEPTTVINTFQHNINGFVTRLKVSSIQNLIDCTENHPFLVYRFEQIDKKYSNVDFEKPKFIFAKDLRVGDFICSPSLASSNNLVRNDDNCEVGNNTLRRIEKIETIPYNGMVYNIEVEGNDDRKSYVAYGLATHNTDVPLSKIHLSLPKGKDHAKNKQILYFYERMCKRVRLFQVLYDMTHEYWLHGVAYTFAEDEDFSNKIPEDLLTEEIPEEIGEIRPDGSLNTKVETKRQPKSEESKALVIKDYVAKHYTGWQRLQVLPPEQIKLEVFQYTNRMRMELIPSEKDRLIVMKAENQDDPEAQHIADDIPDQIRENLLSGQPIPLNTSPYDDFLCSSFCHMLAHKKSPYEDRGISLLERCLRTLTYLEKLRQSQTSIASRAMTPKRIVWGDKISQVDVDDLRDQVEQALIDPDFTIVANYEVHWDEIGARDRLLDLTSEYEMMNKLLYIGLRITESMLTGESTYSGERIHLDVMNTMYLLYRETLVEYVEESLFAPVAEKKGFWEEDENGDRHLLYPKLKFTRLALRDNSELQDFMFNLYQKGSMPIGYIYDLLNIDVDDAHAELLKDVFTLRDSSMNELIRSLLSDAGSELLKNSDVLKKLAKNLNLKLEKTEEDRFE